ncbi:MAG: carboxypeptidase regulatory-like domain-containing protein [Bryobacterales bacterium]|nr:carboxypeptidase regulatory-like domain-containing protein [Bryobacterales bacterium]
MGRFKELNLTLPVLVALFVSGSLAWAQTGSVKSQGQPVPGAVVRAEQGDRVLSALTDANGEFKLDKMPAGAWTIDVSMFGFAQGHREVQIGANPVKLDFTLEIGTSRTAFGARGGLGSRTAIANGGDRGELSVSGPSAASGGPAPGGQPEAAGAAPADVSALQQANAGGANESFLVNGSLSTGLQTQAADFAPTIVYGGFGGPGGPSAAQGGTAGVPGQEGAPAGGPGSAGGGPVVFGGGPGVGGPGGGGFAGRGGPGGGGFGGGGGPGGRFGPGRGPGGRGPGGSAGSGGLIGNRRNGARRQIRGSVYYSLRDSVFDAAPFSLNGQANTKAAYA